jgi:hypothetical protein
LTEAGELLPETFQGPFPDAYSKTMTRVKRDAAFAMLARVQFQKGTVEGYEKAVEAANKVLGIKYGEIQESRALANSVKTVFRIKGSGAQGINSEIIVQLANASYKGYNTRFALNVKGSTDIPFFLPNAKFTALKSKLTDTRYSDLIEEVGKGTKKIIVVRKYDIAESQYMNFPLLRSAELVLTRAESNWNLKNYDEAFADYKLVKSRSIAAAKNEVKGTESAILDSLQKERVRELVFEGDRYFDLLRRHSFIAKGSESVPEFNWDDPKAAARIPDSEILLNPLWDK